MALWPMGNDIVRPSKVERYRRSLEKASAVGFNRFCNNGFGIGRLPGTGAEKQGRKQPTGGRYA